jgi:hypothetical protein
VKYRASTILPFFILAIATHANTTDAQEADGARYRVNLPSLELDQAAERLQNKTGIKLSYPVAIGRLKMPAVRGRMNAVEALIALLSPSGLGYRVIGSRAKERSIERRQQLSVQRRVGAAIKRLA